MYLARRPAAVSLEPAPDALSRPPLSLVREECPQSARSYYVERRSWPAILLIVLVHVAVIAALVKLDVVQIAANRPSPVLIDLKPLGQVPLPRAQSYPKAAKPDVKQPTPIVAPPPVVATAATASPVQATAVPVPVPPAPPSAEAPAAAPSPIAAPITPPDASAATLGNSAPRYPIESRRAREQGTVRLRVLISPGGRVVDVSVARSSGFGRLDEAALEAVRRWRFRPGMQAGQPVEAVGYLSIPFVLSR